jgi:hypothetical protein
MLTQIQALRPGSEGDNNMAGRSSWSCARERYDSETRRGSSFDYRLPASDLLRNQLDRSAEVG